jgi:hypothetical protein
VGIEERADVSSRYRVLRVHEEASTMEVLVHSESAVDVRPDLDRHVRGVLTSRLARYRDRLTRVSVGFADENRRQVGVPDLRCTIEARPAGLDPVAVTANAPGLVACFDAAVEKLMSVLQTRLGKEADHKGAPSIRRSGPD